MLPVSSFDVEPYPALDFTHEEGPSHDHPRTSTLPDSPSSALRENVVRSFAFLDTPDRSWALDYVLGWRDRGKVNDLSAIILGVGGKRSAPFEMVAVGPDPSGITCANQLLWLWIPVKTVGGVTIGVAIERLSAVEGFSSYAVPSMPSVEDGHVHPFGRFALLESTGELVTVSTSSEAPAMFPGAEMTQITHLRCEAGRQVVGLSYVLSSSLPAFWRSPSVDELAAACILSEAASFRRSVCSVCRGFSSPGRTCLCPTAGECRTARNSANANFGALVCRTEADDPFEGEFAGFSQIYIKSPSGIGVDALTLPSMNIQTSFMDNSEGDRLADELNMLAIRSVVQVQAPPAILNSSSLMPEERDLVQEAAHVSILTAMGNDQSTDGRSSSNSRTSNQSRQVHGARSSSESGASTLDAIEHFPSSPFGIEFGVQSGVNVDPCIGLNSREEPNTETGRVSNTSQVPCSTSDAGSSPLDEGGSRRGRSSTTEKRSAEEILEDRRRKNRLSARKSDLRRKEVREALERDVNEGHARVAALQTRKASLEAENAELKRRLGES